MYKLLLKPLPLATILLTSFIFFQKLFIPQSIFITPDYGRSDSWHFSIANKYYYSQELKKNRVPVWNPQIGRGFPTLAEGQTGIFFLPNLLLFRSLPFVLAYNLNLVLAFILAHSGVYLFLRSQNLTKSAATYGGIIFAFGGFFILHVQHLHLIQTASILPWLFWASSEFLQKRKVVYLIILPLFISQQFFAGFPQLTIYSQIALFVYLFIKIVFFQKSKKAKISFLLFFSILLGYAVSAIQLIPSYELLTLANREISPANILQQFPYKGENLLQFLNPFVFGSPKDGSYPAWQPGTWGIFWESSAYVGIIPLSLALALVVASLKKKNATIRAISFLALLSLLLSLGGSSPLHPIYSFSPFSLFRVPSRFLLITQFCLAVLAGFYLQKLAREKIIPAAILILSILNLYFTFGSYNPRAKAESWFSPPQTSNWLKENSSRIYSYGQNLTWNENFAEGWQDTGYYFFARNSLDQNSNLIFGKKQFSAYESIVTKRSAVYSSILGQGIKRENDEIELSPLSTKILAASDVGYIITPFELSGSNKVYETNKYKNYSFKIYEISKNPSRFFATAKYQVADSIPQITRIFSQENFDPTSEIILEKPPNLDKLVVRDWSANILEETPTKIVVNVDIKGNGFFVLADSFYPGWKAQVDGQEKEILAANINNQAVVLEEGSHRVIFKYDPDSIRHGKFITIAALTLLALLFLRFKNFKVT